MHLQLVEAMQQRVYPITRRIAIGQFATPQRVADLLRVGTTHVLNVGEAESVAVASPDGFLQVVDRPLIDFERIDDASAISCLDALHAMVTTPNSRVYVHCIACQNRSPTIVWLYLVACGLDHKDAKRLITERCPDAVPGHKSLVDDELIALAVEHGRKRFQPIADREILQPAY